jgi:membrane protease subunit HflK
VIKPAVTRILQGEFGFRTVVVGPPARYRDVDAEALMLTGDENIVKLQFIVQFKGKTGPTGATDFLFNVRDRQDTVRDAAEAAMREVLGRNDIDTALTEGQRAGAAGRAERCCNASSTSIGSASRSVTVKLQDVDPPNQVSDAFKDVISAQQTGSG